MKARTPILSLCILVLCAFSVQASVFSGSGGSSLQSLFNSMGYDYIDVANYQTDLNLKLHGSIQFQLLSKSGAMDLRFGVLENRQRWFGTYHVHRNVFGADAEVGSTAMFRADSRNTSYGFYISKPGDGRWWRRSRIYSYSPFNRSGAVQALFYADPLNSNSYLLAWDGVWAGSPYSDKTYDDLVIRMTVHPAPEPATWVLLASGLVGLAVLGTIRKKQRERA